MAKKTLRCRLGMHRWVVRHEPETGDAFHVCTRCGKERSPDGPSVPHGLAAE